jgi:hypothetical protein
MLIFGVACIAHLAVIYKVPESPKFLYVNKRWDELHNALLQISKSNNSLHWNLKFKEEIDHVEVNEDHQSLSLLVALKDRIYMKNLCIMVMNWTVCSLSFYVMGYYINDFPGNLFINALAILCADIIANGCSYIYVKSIGFNNAFGFAYIVIILATIIFNLFHGSVIVDYG